MRASLNAVDTELLSRWGPLAQIEGHAISAASDTHANLLTLGDGRNSQFQVIVGTYKLPTPPHELAAAVGAAVSFHGEIDRRDPSRRCR